MTSLTTFCLVEAVLCTFAIIPLARLIPLRMHQQWRDDMVSNGVPAPPVNEAEFALPMASKVAVLVACCLAGLLAAARSTTEFQAAMLCVYLFGLVLLAAINQKHLLLPDVLVIPLMWMGLLLGVNTEQGEQHVLGAVAAYLGPFILIRLIRLVSKREIIGGGDLKALAMAGAWFGLAAVPQLLGVFAALVVLSSLLALTPLRQYTAGTGWVHIGASLSYLLLPYSA